MGPRFCEECGHALHEGAHFCGACGHPVTPGGAVAASAEPTEPTEPVGPAPAESAPPPPVREPTVTAAAPPPAAAVPPPAAPPGPPPGPAAGGSGGGWTRNPWLMGLLAVVVLAVAGVVIALVLAGGDDEPSRADREVLLETAASAGPAPFTPALAPETVTAPSTVTTVPPVTAAPSGRTAQGPFGGTGDNSVCDRELLVEFLTDPANAAVAREWARVLDVRVADIPTYVRALIPTTLTADARVTNHRFENGRAVGYQAVLERGTAVLVDTNGRLIARCRCGNPLLPPQEIAKPIYTGPKWPGFDPTVIVVVVPSPTPVFPPGGVGTIPQTTSPTNRPGTTQGDVRTEPDEAVRLLREPFELCARSSPDSIFSPSEIEQILASATYQATLVDQRTGTYTVVVSIPSRTLDDGSELIGESATWEVSVLTGEITPADANAQLAAENCAALG